jgi:glycopeptide antibiotics resistance protein
MCSCLLVNDVLTFETENLTKSLIVLNVTCISYIYNICPYNYLGLKLRSTTEDRLIVQSCGNPFQH